MDSNVNNEFTREEAFNQAAAQAAFSRELEINGAMQRNRDGVGYLTTLFGIGHLTDYIKTAQAKLGTNRVLDIGAGSTRAIAQLSRTSFMNSLSCEATVLTNVKDIEKNLGKERTHITPVETLEGIADKSVACVLSVNGVAYSVVPSLAIEQIDRILVDGGVIKATFQNEGHISPLVRMNTHDKFTEELRKRGYEVEITTNEKELVDVVVAVKKGSTVHAKTLLEEDLRDWQKQIDQFNAELKPEEKK